MPNSPAWFSLRSLLLVDAATCAVMGVFLVATTSLVAQFTLIPATLLWYAGLSLFPIAGFMAVVAVGEPVHPTPAAIIIAGNLLWVVGSVLLLVTGWIAPNYLGSGLIAAQALVVSALAKLEIDALRRQSLKPRTT